MMNPMRILRARIAALLPGVLASLACVAQAMKPYARPQAWQEGWRVVNFGGPSLGIGDLSQVVMQDARAWVAVQKENFADQRIHVFASARIGEHLAPDGTGWYPAGFEDQGHARLRLLHQALAS